MARISHPGALCGATLVLLSIVSPAIAMPAAQPLGGPTSPSLQNVSVFCGATGCQPITKVKKCAPDNQNHAAANGQREVIVRRTCNFM